MNTGWRVAASTTIALTAICVWLGWNVVASPGRPSDGGGRSGLRISSIDLATGTRDAVLSASDMMPGDQVTAEVTVVNSGSRAVTYTMRRGVSLVGGDALSAALTLTVKTVGSSCADFDGTTLYDGPLDSATLERDGSSRPLPAATAEILCFRVVLPPDVGNGSQGIAATVRLVFAPTAAAATR
jgi:hypothetical protein